MPVETLHIDPQHPAFAGHFPGRPIVPGVLLLDRVQRAIEFTLGGAVTGLAMAKFLSPAVPGDVLTLEHECTDASVRFTIRCGERVVANGRFAWQVKGCA